MQHAESASHGVLQSAVMSNGKVSSRIFKVAQGKRKMFGPAMISAVE